MLVRAGPAGLQFHGRNKILRKVQASTAFVPGARYLTQVGLVAAAYFLVAGASLALAIPPGYATAVWPPSGLALAAILLLGNRVWPGIWIGAALANAAVETALFPAPLIAAGNTLEALATAALIRRHVGDPGQFERIDSVVRFVLACALCATIAATIAVLGLAAMHGLSWEESFRNWWTWWQGDTTGMIILAPLILSWMKRNSAWWPANRRMEAAAFGALLLLAAAAIATGDSSQSGPFSLAFMTLPFIMWGAFRFGQREVTAAIAVICAVALWYTVVRRDPTAPLNELLLLLLTFISMVVTTGLVLVAALAERRPTADEVRKDPDNRVDGSAGTTAEERIRRLNRVHAVLSGISSLIVRVNDREELFAQACRIAVEAGELRMGWLGIYDRKAKRVVPMASYGEESGFLGLMSLSLDDPAPEGRGLVRRALREKQPVVINHMAHDAKFRLREEALSRGYLSGAALPLAIDGEVVGVLGLFAGEPDFFDDEEMRLLIDLAGNISLALDHIEKSQRLRYIAHYDPLTGLPNRALFEDRLAQVLAVRGEQSEKIAVAVLDLDRFKTINDTLGRQAGDDLLRQVARRLSHDKTGGSIVARLGRDRFALAAHGFENESAVSRVADKSLARWFGVPFSVEGKDLRISARMGVALFPDDAGTAHTLFMHAESALKKAKMSGERFLFYTQKMSERVAESLSLENKLRRAIEREEFELHYQPKVDVDTRHIVGLEALLRWRSPELGLVPPGQFIPLLEETEMVLEVGDWVLRRAVLDHASWTAEGVRAPRIAVNVSSIQLRQRNFVELVRAAIGLAGSANVIDLEITESRIMDDIEANITKLRELRDLGLGVAIDDFGTGYSSLAYLAKLPVQILKIDRSFIATMLDDDETMALVQTIISLAQTLDLKTIAEGVETEAQANMLALLRCDQFQGYLVSKPRPREELTPLLPKL